MFMGSSHLLSIAIWLPRWQPTWFLAGEQSFFHRFLHSLLEFVMPCRLHLPECGERLNLYVWHPDLHSIVSAISILLLFTGHFMCGGVTQFRIKEAELWNPSWRWATHIKSSECLLFSSILLGGTSRFPSFSKLFLFLFPKLLFFNMWVPLLPLPKWGLPVNVDTHMHAWLTPEFLYFSQKSCIWVNFLLDQRTKIMTISLIQGIMHLIFLGTVRFIVLFPV